MVKNGPQWAQFLPTSLKTKNGCGMQRSRAWCGTPPILGVVNMVGTRNFTCYMGALCCNNVPSMFRLLDIARFALFAI